MAHLLINDSVHLNWYNSHLRGVSTCLPHVGTIIWPPSPEKLCLFSKSFWLFCRCVWIVLSSILDSSFCGLSVRDTGSLHLDLNIQGTSHRDAWTPNSTNKGHQPHQPAWQCSCKPCSWLVSAAMSLAAGLTVQLWALQLACQCHLWALFGC